MNTNEIYERITATIIEMLEDHKESNYSECWYSLSGDVFARNVETGHQYSGINQIMLSHIKRKKNYIYNRWLTFKQIEKNNAHIIKGSKSAMVVYTSALYIDEETGVNITSTVEKLLKTNQSIDHLNAKRTGYLKSYNVFNVSCIEGLPEEYYKLAELDNLQEIERDGQAENIITCTGANICSDIRNEAFYRSKEDKIYMPLTKQFVSKETYYSVMFHELGHWTGAASRLNRPQGNKFGSKEYAFEELVAEMNSAYILAYLGYESRITDNVDYIDNWLSVMKNDTKFVIQAASQAQAAADYILKPSIIKEKAA